MLVKGAPGVYELITPQTLVTWLNIDSDGELPFAMCLLDLLLHPYMWLHNTYMIVQVNLSYAELF